MVNIVSEETVSSIFRVEVIPLKRLPTLSQPKQHLFNFFLWFVLVFKKPGKVNLPL
jgi:hypothetical protein